VPSRRDAIKQLAGLSALATLAPASASAAALRSDTKSSDDSATLVPVAGLGLYTVRSEMQKSVEATLARIAKIGYREVEFAGYFGKTPKEIAAILKANGLTSPSVHVPLNDLRTKLDESLDAAATIGHKYIVCPYVDDSERGAAENYRRIAADNNKAAEAAQKRGLLFAYHNHAFEFDPIAGTTGMSILLAEFDPKLVKFEMDLYWMAKAKQDPIAFFKKYPGRVHLAHVKDMATDGSFADVGTGTINFHRIFAHAREAGIKHFYVENDQPKDVFPSITTSYAALRKLRAT
jgi:sugar phosphate isomerase/epimerase